MLRFEIRSIICYIDYAAATDVPVFRTRIRPIGGVKTQKKTTVIGDVRMENMFWIGIFGALVALCFAFVQSRKVLSYSEGTPAMQKIAAAIRQGATAYLKASTPQFSNSSSPWR